MRKAAIKLEALAESISRGLFFCEAWADCAGARPLTARSRKEAPYFFA